jgi:hypothetical protein
MSNYVPSTGQIAGSLAFTGTPIVAMHWVAVGVALFVIGSLAMVAARLLPRFAFDPIQGGDRRYQLRFTKNGHPVRPQK